VIAKTENPIRAMPGACISGSCRRTFKPLRNPQTSVVSRRNPFQPARYRESLCDHQIARPFAIEFFKPVLISAPPRGYCLLAIQPLGWRYAFTGQFLWPSTARMELLTWDTSEQFLERSTACLCLGLRSCSEIFQTHLKISARDCALCADGARFSLRASLSRAAEPAL